jgi:ribosomal protein S6--L-glutamate ligase
VPKTNIIIAALNPELFTTKRLISEATKLKHAIFYHNPYEFQIPLKRKELSGIYLHRTTGTNYDDFDLMVTKHHELQGMDISNPLEALKVFRAKDQQSLFFREHKLPTIPTYLYRGKLMPVHESDLRRLSPNQKYILKMNRGNQGIGVNFLESHKSLLSILETFHAMKDQRFLIQPFIEHSKEWRLFIIKNEIVACIEKTLKKDDFRGNAKRSSGRFLKKIPTPLRDVAQKAFHASALDYAGIDILLSDKGELLILEINPIPGFEQAEELSGKNIAKELILALT